MTDPRQWGAAAHNEWGVPAPHTLDFALFGRCNSVAFTHIPSDDLRRPLCVDSPRPSARSQQACLLLLSSPLRAVGSFSSAKAGHGGVCAGLRGSSTS